MEGKQVMSKEYRKTNDLMREAALILVKRGWRARQFEQLFGISRSSAFRLAKVAREEHSKAVVAEALDRARRQAAQEAVKLRDEWQRETRSPEGAGEVRRGYSQGSNVRFRS
jgi:hypothetical protein